MTVSKPASPSRRAIDYAENVLGVNAIYEGVVVTRNRLDETYTELSNLKDEKRIAEQRVADRELELISDEHGRHPEMSVAAMERHLKLELPKDGPLRSLRSKVTMSVSAIDGLEYDIKMFETDIRIAVSRMQELGGYLAYLAAIKTQSGSANQPAQPGSTE